MLLINSNLYRAGEMGVCEGKKLLHKTPLESIKKNNDFLQMLSGSNEYYNRDLIKEYSLNYKASYNYLSIFLRN